MSSGQALLGLRGSRPRYSRFVIATVVACVVWGVDMVGGLSTIEQRAYDEALHYSVRFRPEPAQVVLVYCDEDLEQYRRDEWASIFRQAQRGGVAHVVLAIPPQPQLEDIIAVVRESGLDITEAPPQVHDVLRLPPAVEATIGENDAGLLPSTVVLAPPVTSVPLTTDGVHRLQAYSAICDGQTVRTMEYAVASDVLGSNDGGLGAQFGIRYRGGAGSLPFLGFQTAAAGSLIPELVGGKVLLIGRYVPGELPGLHTPTTRNGELMTALEYHGNALNTLLNRHAIRWSPPSARLPLYMFFALLSVVIYQQCSMRFGLVVAGVLLAIELAVSFLLLSTLRLWLPCLQLVLVQLVTLAFVFQRRASYTAAIVSQLIHELSTKLLRRRWATGFLSLDDPWNRVASFLRQTFQLRRLIILDLPEHSYHVREVHAYNCSMSEIDEKRRDCRRWPYAAVVEARRPIALGNNRPYLKALEKDDQQYLAPLIFAGELFGFLALSVSTRVLHDHDDFESRLRDFAENVAELLYRRRTTMHEQKSMADWRRRFIRTPEDVAYSELLQATHLLESRLERLENMFDKSATPSAVYDVFGRLLMINGEFCQLLERHGHNPSELTTVDLITVLADDNIEHAQSILRNVIASHRVESTSVEFEGEGKQYTLQVRPLELELPGTDAIASQTGTHQLQGILCELVERSVIARHERIKEELAGRLGMLICNELKDLDQAVQSIVDEHADPAASHQYRTVVQVKVQDAVATLQQCQKYLSPNLPVDETICVPVSPLAALDHAVRRVQPAMQEQGVTLKMQRTDLASHVLAAPRAIHEVFEAALSCLLLDAKDDSKLILDVDEREAEIVFMFSNQGFGVALQPLEEILDESRDPGIEEYRRLREGVRAIRQWGGRMTMTSEIGSGTSVEVSFKRFR